MGLLGWNSRKEARAAETRPKLVFQVFSWRRNSDNCGLYEVVVSQLGVDIVRHGQFSPGTEEHDAAYAKAINCQQKCIDEISQLSPQAMKWREWLHGHTMQKFLMHEP